MRIFLVSFVTALLIMLELLAGNYGLCLAFPLIGSVYFAVAYRKRTGFISACAAGLVLDALYCRDEMLLMLLYPAAVLAALQIIRQTRRRMPFAPLAAGAVLGAVVNGGNIVLCLIYQVPLNGPDLPSMLVFQVTVSAILMLLFTWTADALAFKCNLPRFKYTGNDSSRRHEHE